MDRIVIPCSKCGRPLSTLPTMARRKCAVCGATTKITAPQREHTVPISETIEKIAEKAKKPQLDPGKTVVEIGGRVLRVAVDQLATAIGSIQVLNEESFALREIFNTLE